MVPVWCRNVGMRERLGLLLKQRRLSQDDVKAVLQVQLYTFLFRHYLHFINLCFVIQVVIFPRLESNNASDCKPITYILLELWYQYMSCTWWWSHYQDFFLIHHFWIYTGVSWQYRRYRRCWRKGEAPGQNPETIECYVRRFVEEFPNMPCNLRFCRNQVTVNLLS